MPTPLERLEDAKALQRSRDLGDVHVVHIGCGGFAIAHTDFEREHREQLPLEECPLHRWISSLDEAPVEEGMYTAIPRVPDAYETDEHPWDLEAIDVDIES